MAASESATASDHGRSDAFQALGGPGSTPSPAQRLVFALLTLVLLGVLCTPFFDNMAARVAPHAQHGLVDYTGQPPPSGPLPLSGEWRLVWLSGGSVPAGTTVWAPVPGAWRGLKTRAGPLPAMGQAAYQLTLRGLPPGQYLLHVPTYFEAVRVSVDGRVVSQRGVVGSTPAATHYAVRSQDVPITATGADLAVQIELAAFHHRDNGMESSPAIGLAEPMSRWTTLGWIRSLLFFTATLFLACYGLVIFFFRSRDRASLYIALAAFALLPIAAIFSHDNLLLVAMPGVSLTGMLTLQYLSGIVAIAFFLAYTHQLFPRESSRKVFWGLQALFAIAFLAHGVALAAGDTLLASKLSFAVLPLRAATFFYILGVVVLAAVRKRDSALMFLLGISIFISTLVTYDLLTNGLIRQQRVNVDLPAIGMLVLLFSHIVILAERWSLALDLAERTNADLRRSLDANARLFAEVTSQRNYNESILRSMSSGVVTLDADGQVAKLNDAAARILGAPADGLAEAYGLLTAHNGWLLEEIEAVAAGGQSKTLLDADLRTPRRSISVNLSIVPLEGDDGRMGVLLLIEDISQGKRLRATMRRFMTQEVVDQVLARDDLLFGDACQASVLFADLRNFTPLAEHLAPRATVELLNEIFTELFEAVSARDGVLDKFLGDALMAHWGAPISSGRDAENAVGAAVQMGRMIAELNHRRREKGLADLRLGVGVASGEVVAGAVGSPKRMDYTVIGDSVNLASRLQEVTKAYQVGVVICEGTAAAIEGGPYELRELDLVRVRGRSRPARIFQVLTEDQPVAAGAVAAYTLGRRRLAERRWQEAVLAFQDAVAADPADAPSVLMLARARILAASPPQVDWDGVWTGE